MPKNIALCSDGTGNTTVKGRGTNVYKLYEAVDLEGAPAQVVFYGDGVGTGGVKIARIFGGAFGYGFARNVRDLYTDLCRVYRPGDRIYLFGFSRGAYTVRALAGLIAACGILDGDALSEQELRRAVKDAYRVYRLRFRPERDQAEATRRAEKFRQRPNLYKPADPVRIAFIGVWDTVGAIGFSDDSWVKRALWWLSGYHVPWFKHYGLGDIVDRACHALSIDDERRTFHPILWNEPADPVTAPDRRGPRLEQVWFAGVHSNVGGGYVKQGMSLVALDWMMTKAEAAGLRFSTNDRALYRERRNVHDKLYDSRSGFAFYYRYAPRDIGAICGKAGAAQLHVHISAFERVGMRSEGYAPGNIPPGSAVDAPGVDPARVGNVQEAVSSALRPGLPLDSAWSYVRQRKTGHLTALCASAALGVAAIVYGLCIDGLTTTAASVVSMSGLVGLGWGLLNAHPIGTLALLAGALGGRVLSQRARRKMQDDFAEVWRPFAKDLRPIP